MSLSFYFFMLKRCRFRKLTKLKRKVCITFFVFQDLKQGQITKNAWIACVNQNTAGFFGSELFTLLKNGNSLARKHLCVFLLKMYWFKEIHKTHKKKYASFFSFFKIWHRYSSQKKCLNSVANKFLFHKTHGERWGSAAWYNCTWANQLQNRNIRLVC